MCTNQFELVRCCQEVLDTFNENTTSMEGHLQDYLENATDLDDGEKIFVEEVFSGAIRYLKILKIITDGFYNRDGRHVLRSEVNLYTVISYLLLFRLNELGIEEFAQFIETQDVNKMYRFLNFVTNECHLRTWMCDSWGRLYDVSFVNKMLITPIRSFLPALHQIVGNLRHLVDNKVVNRREVIRNTDMQPFNLTQVKPRGVPMPEEIPGLPKANCIPATTYQKPIDKVILSEKRELNRRMAEERLVIASHDRYACANPGKSQRTQLLIKSMQDAEAEKLQFNIPKCNSAPKGLTSTNIPIKLNAATILREGNLYQKREADELDKLARLQAGESDLGPFLTWQAKMRRQDADGEKANGEKRRIAGKLSYEDAILAHENIGVSNRAKVVQMRQKAEQYMQRYLEDRMRDDEQARKRVEQVMSTQANCREVRKKLQAYKAKIVQGMAEESREMMRQALEEATHELQQRMQLIEEIRAFHAVPIVRTKTVDFTQTAGFRFLGEMSLAELQERLSLMREARAEADESKRDGILAAKEAKDNMLMETLWQISRHRTEQSQTAARRLQKPKPAKVPVEDAELSELQRRLEERRSQRMERVKTAQKVSAITMPIQQADNKKRMEMQRWEKLEETREKLITMGLGRGAGRGKHKITAP